MINKTHHITLVKLFEAIYHSFIVFYNSLVTFEVSTLGCSLLYGFLGSREMLLLLSVGRYVSPGGRKFLNFTVILVSNVCCFLFLNASEAVCLIPPFAKHGNCFLSLGGLNESDIPKQYRYRVKFC